MITLFTLCPECKTEYSISVKQLRISRAIVECKHCAIKFDALELLNDTPIQHPLSPFFTLSDSELPPLPWEQKSREKWTTPWASACILSGLLLAFQVYWFASNDLPQNLTFRPLLERTCAILNCTVPTYDNLAAIKISHVNLQTLNNRQLLFQLAFSNDAVYKQQLPKLKLILLHYNGDVLKQRLFTINEYLPTRKQKLINAHEQVEVKLIIAEPAEKFGGYQFKLM